MITVLVMDGSVYKFHNARQASLWLKANPEIYGSDMDNVLVVGSEPFTDVPIINPIMNVHTIQCGGCSNHLRFEVSEDDEDIVVECPACHGRNRIHIG